MLRISASCINFAAATTTMWSAMRLRSDGKAPVWGHTQLNRLSFIDVVPVVPHRVGDESSEERPTWQLADVENVAITHKKPNGLVDTLAYRGVRTCRWAFDTFSLYRFGSLTEGKVINRCLFLETVAGVPGMVGGMLRHLKSLRYMTRDKGWINTLLVEAENERMHLMTFIELRQPGFTFRVSIIVTQAIMYLFLLTAYIISPRFVHRFVGYLEEEAVITYTSILRAIDEGRLRPTKSDVPEVARVYWNLSKDATFRDLINVIRADEAEHRVVNHTFADMHEHHLQNSVNPFVVLKKNPAELYNDQGATKGASACTAEAATKSS
uniref:Alternative oxidase n=1 Tax=Trypanosoma congolense TaxID=5692 RepID=Q4AEA1_TRYCO|nr:alternative oxidase [Trypanosoma congolense]